MRLSTLLVRRAMWSGRCGQYCVPCGTVPRDPVPPGSSARYCCCNAPLFLFNSCPLQSSVIGSVGRNAPLVGRRDTTPLLRLYSSAGMFIVVVFGRSHPWKWPSTPPSLITLFVVSNLRNGGHHSSAARCSKACTILFSRWWEVKACSPTLGRRTHSTTLGSPTSTACPSLDSRLRRGHCGSGGHNFPPPLCARHGDDTETLVARGGLRTQVFRGQQNLFSGVRWVDGVGGRVM